jgi:hypothetical protein
MLRLCAIALLSLTLVGCDGLPRKFAGKYFLQYGNCLHDQIVIEMSDEIDATKVIFNDTVRNNSLIFVYDSKAWDGFHETCDGITCAQRMIKYENQTLTDSSQTIVRIVNEETGTKFEQVVIPWTTDIHAVFETDKITLNGRVSGGQTCEYVRR